MLRATGHTRMVKIAGTVVGLRSRSPRSVLTISHRLGCQARVYMCPCYGPLISRAQEKGDHNMGAGVQLVKLA